MSDVDRADSAQAEWFRILTDSIEGRILDPHGKMVPIFPGTQFVCTANSCGSGDARGRMASANPMDASIMDRLGRKIESTYLDWEDEERVLRAKFPRVAELAAEVFPSLGSATQSLRKAIEAEEIYAEFTHRGLCEVLGECDDILHYLDGRKIPENLLKRGFRAWFDGLDADSHLTAKRLVDPFLKGGAFGSADKDDEY
jgi:MoxR-like ATPase